MLHGMLSNAASMTAVARALDARRLYRKVKRYSITDWQHLFVPQLRAKAVASGLCEERIRPALASGELEAPLDLLGHSNGGYVALHMAAELGPGLVRRVFTLATPRVVLADPIAVSAATRVFHLRGGLDLIPFGGNHNPSSSNWIVTFPDEGHCSLHAGAATNGLIEVIALLAGGPSGDIFVDGSGTIHPWPFCADEAAAAPRALLRSAPTLFVCDGVHAGDPDAEPLETLTDAVFIGTAARLPAYWLRRQRLAAQLRAVQEECRRLRSSANELRGALVEVSGEEKRIEKRAADFERALKRHVRRHREALRVDLGRVESAFDAAVLLASGPKFYTSDMEAVVRFLEVALESHTALTTQIRRAGLRGDPLAGAPGLPTGPER